MERVNKSEVLLSGVALPLLCKRALPLTASNEPPLRRLPASTTASTWKAPSVDTKYPSANGKHAEAVKMVRTNEKLHQDLQPHQLQILPIRQYSDGRGRICPRAMATKNNRYGKRRIAEFWANDRTSGIAVQAGRIPELSQLPAGYDCWQLDKPNPRSGQNRKRQATTTEYIVTGHPQGDFPSLAKFYVHFKHIQDYGTEANCSCDRCVAARGRQAGVAAAPNMIVPANSIPPATQHQVMPQQQAVPQQVSATSTAQQIMMAPTTQPSATPALLQQKTAGAPMQGRKRSAPPAYPAPPPIKRHKSALANQLSRPDERSQAPYSYQSPDPTGGLSYTQLTARLHRTEYNRAPASDPSGRFPDTNALAVFDDSRQHSIRNVSTLQSHSAPQQTDAVTVLDHQNDSTNTQSSNPVQPHAPADGVSCLDSDRLSDNASHQNASFVIQCDICGNCHAFGYLCEYGGGKFVFDGFDWQFEPADEPSIDLQRLL